ncbi:MAG: DUF1127 domain-containing protein [Geminicoccaceae bacterium]
MQAKLLHLPRFHVPAAHGRWAQLAARLAGWLQSRGERHDLARLDARTLADIGLTRGDVERELDRPFWEPVDHAGLEAARRRSGPRLGG